MVDEGMIMHLNATLPSIEGVYLNWKENSQSHSKLKRMVDVSVSLKPLLRIVFDGCQAKIETALRKEPRKQE